MACEIRAYPEYLEITVKDNKKIAVHERSFQKRQKIELPSHRERLLFMTPQFKQKRIYQLMNNMDKGMEKFIAASEAEGQDPATVAYELFQILRNVSKEMLLSAIRQANDLGISKVRYIKSLLQLPSDKGDHPVYPQDAKLLEITYEGRQLRYYDELI